VYEGSGCGAQESVARGNSFFVQFRKRQSFRGACVSPFSSSRYLSRSLRSKPLERNSPIRFFRLSFAVVESIESLSTAFFATGLVPEPPEPNMAHCFFFVPTRQSVPLSPPFGTPALRFVGWFPAPFPSAESRPSPGKLSLLLILNFFKRWGESVFDSPCSLLACSRL